jgi:hypothetical protein
MDDLLMLAIGAVLVAATLGLTRLVERLMVEEKAK